MMTTQRQVRAAFWAQFDGVRKPGNQDKQVTDTRVVFVEFVDYLARNGEITEALARRVTL